MTPETVSLSPPVYVLRIGHRPARDKRITTHAALVARAFGARGFLLAEVCDAGVLRSVLKVERTWGRGFDVIACTTSWRSVVGYWKRVGWPVVHLTMYGLPVSEVIEGLRRITKPLLVVVGAEKVPRELFELADYNLAITSQPHSEVGALAVFLDRLYNGMEENIRFRGAKLAVIPSPREKRVVRLDKGAEKR